MASSPSICEILPPGTRLGLILDFCTIEAENGLKPVQMGKYIMSPILMPGEIMGTLLLHQLHLIEKTRAICSASRYIFM